MPATAHRPARRRRWAAAALRITVSVALLAVLFSTVGVRDVWERARQASLAWLAVALAFHALHVLASVWRWHLLIDAQRVAVTKRALLDSYLVALFFNNFLPSNIGGDVIRIRDTAPALRSRTLATTIVLVDRGVGLMALVFVAALGATIAGSVQGHAPPIWPAWLWAGFLTVAAVGAPAVLAPAGVGRLLQPLTSVHAEWVGHRIEKLTGGLARFRERPATLAACFLGAIAVQLMLVGYYAGISRALEVDIGFWDLAVIVPLSFILQMVPASVNGFGVREATFAFYFARIGLPVQAAMAVSLMAAGLGMLFSLIGAAVYIARHARGRPRNVADGPVPE